MVDTTWVVLNPAGALYVYVVAYELTLRVVPAQLAGGEVFSPVCGERGLGCVCWLGTFCPVRLVGLLCGWELGGLVLRALPA